MAIASSVKKLLQEWEKEHKDQKGKAYLTSGSRTADEQLQIILDPKRKRNYPNIKNRFKKKYSLEELPLYKDLTNEQKKWWIAEINKQAGKPDGFAHVGGNAQDVSVKALKLDAKSSLKEKFETKFKVYLEQVTGNDSKYGVSLSAANVFHVYK